MAATIKKPTRVPNGHLIKKDGTSLKNGGSTPAWQKKEGKKAPKVINPKPKENYMKESDTKNRLKSKMWPMKSKRLSK